MKKLLTIILALVFVCCGSMPVFVDSEDPVIIDDASNELAQEFADYLSTHGMTLDDNNFFMAEMTRDTGNGQADDPVRFRFVISTNSKTPLELGVGWIHDDDRIPIETEDYDWEWYAEALKAIEKNEKPSYTTEEYYASMYKNISQITVSSSEPCELLAKSAYTLTVGTDTDPNDSDNSYFCVNVLNPEAVTKGTTITIHIEGAETAADSGMDYDKYLEKAKEATAAKDMYILYPKSSNGKKYHEVTYTFTGRGWVTDTDAGYYMDAQTKYGVIRFLFDSGVDASKITGSGIKFVNSADFIKPVEASGDLSGNKSAFYGDITQIPADDSSTYYAVAYVTTTDGSTSWSKVVECKPNFNTLINYGGGNE